MKKEKLTKRRFIKCSISIALTLILLVSMITVMMTPVHALGGISEYELDGFEYYVEWSEDEWGEGLAFFHCEYCSAGYGREFSDGDHEGCVADMISEDFPYDCDHCSQCADDYHCAGCGECFESGSAESCPYCNSMYCLDCHDDTYFCDICGNCRLEDGASGLSLSGHLVDLPNLSAVCEECLDDIETCVICGNTLSLGGGDYLTYDELGVDWCEDCGICGVCYEDYDVTADYGHCAGCGVCGNDADVCDICHLCENCREGVTHCPECDECFDDEVEWCASGGNHCIKCCEVYGVCSQCGECMEVTGGELCADCELCEECCLSNSESEGCTHSYCVESSEYEDHVCPECGQCPDDMECEYCGLCEDCQENYHCDHGICPENYDE